MTRAEHVNGNADEVEHDRRHVEHVIGPVAPAGKESVEIAENLLGPQIDATFARVAVSEFDDGDTLRPEEQKQGDDPEPNRNATVGGDRGNDVEIENGNHEEEHEIAASEGTDQVGLSGLGCV